MIVAASHSSEHLRRDRERRARAVILQQYAVASAVAIALFFISMVTG